MTDLEKARQVFEGDRYAQLTGVEITFVGDWEAVCTLALDERHRNARDVAMGGVLFTLADFSAAVAANTEILNISDTLLLPWVSLDGNIHYLSPANGTRLVARCRALKSGRSTALYQTTVFDPDSDKTVAIVETTMIKVNG